MARLPQPGGDSGNWGDILNDYLSQVLKTDGTIKDNAVTNSAIAPGAVTSVELAPGSVNSNAIASDAVSATQIADGSITEMLLASAVQTKLNAGTSSPDWSTITNKPTVIAAGADQASARTAIGAGISNLVIGTTSTTAKAGNYAPTATDVGLGNVSNTSDATKNSATATLTNKDLTSGTNTFPTFNQSTTGNAATATKLATARNINGVAFDGSANITITDPGAIEVVTYSGSLGATRPTAPAVYWVGFPSTPTNVQSQDIVSATTVASPKIITEYSGVTSLSNQAFPTSGGKAPTGVTVDILIAPGTGGGSGRRGAAGTVRNGGGGGTGGGYVRGLYIPASLFGNGWNINIPVAGLGGAAVTTDNTNGNNGALPVGGSTVTSFVTQFTLVQATSGDVGYGGTATGGAGNNYTGGGISGVGGSGSAASSTGGAGTSNINYAGGPAGGSGGGGITSGNVAGVSAAGSYNPYFPGVGAGAAGVVDSTLPTSGSAIAGVPGDSGGSGSASVTKAAQAAANSVGYGAGGSGGGASVNGFASGAGGNGGPGFIRLIWDYS